MIPAPSPSRGPQPPAPRCVICTAATLTHLERRMEDIPAGVVLDGLSGVIRTEYIQPIDYSPTFGWTKPNPILRSQLQAYKLQVWGGIDRQRQDVIVASSRLHLMSVFCCVGRGDVCRGVAWTEPVSNHPTTSHPKTSTHSEATPSQTPPALIWKTCVIVKAGVSIEINLTEYCFSSLYLSKKWLQMPRFLLVAKTRTRSL
jgi:hypothetical protein